MGEVDSLRIDPEDRAADSNTAAQRRRRFALRGRVVRIKSQAQGAAPLPRDVPADRVIDRPVGGHRTSDRQILARIVELLGEEQRTGGRAICPTAGGVAAGEPDADAVLLRTDSILREDVIDGSGQRIGRPELQDGLAVYALAVDVDEVIGGILGHLINVSRPRVIGDLTVQVLAVNRVAPIVGIDRDRFPIVLVAIIARTPAGRELRDARLAP